MGFDLVTLIVLLIYVCDVFTLNYLVWLFVGYLCLLFYCLTLFLWVVIAYYFVLCFFDLWF